MKAVSGGGGSAEGGGGEGGLGTHWSEDEGGSVGEALRAVWVVGFGGIGVRMRGVTGAV